ncbi:hypothetical protein K1X76_09080, partial [bacterium]|nr:hypothetical protein [bacterium]
MSSSTLPSILEPFYVQIRNLASHCVDAAQKSGILGVGTNDYGVHDSLYRLRNLALGNLTLDSYATVDHDALWESYQRAFSQELILQGLAFKSLSPDEDIRHITTNFLYDEMGWSGNAYDLALAYWNTDIDKKVDLKTFGYSPVTAMAEGAFDVSEHPWLALGSTLVLGGIAYFCPPTIPYIGWGGVGLGAATTAKGVVDSTTADTPHQAIQADATIGKGLATMALSTATLASIPTPNETSALIITPKALTVVEEPVVVLPETPLLTGPVTIPPPELIYPSKPLPPFRADPFEAVS